MLSSNSAATEHEFVTGVPLPDGALVREATEFIHDTESVLLFNSRRVFFFASLSGQRRQLHFDPELLYIGAMFHNIGLVPKYSSEGARFEVDGANAARDFLIGHGIAQRDIDDVWTAIALHTTPGIPQYLNPVVALVTAGVELDVLGIGLTDLENATRSEILARFTRTEHFKEDIIQAFYEGLKHKPGTTFGNIKADVLADKDPHFQRINFCSIIRGSGW